MRQSFLLGLLPALLILAGVQPLSAQEPADPADASYQWGEYQRLQTIDRMLLRIEQIRASRPIYPSIIWGFPDIYYAPQSIGQRRVQTGPNRWESYPIYGEPVPPPKPALSGPREF